MLSTYEGTIHIFDLQHLHSGSLNTQNSEVLHAHLKGVYSLVWLNGGIGENGYTTFCPTFIGKAKSFVSREFLVSVGYGKHSFFSERLSSSLKSSVQLRGVYVNMWMI